MQNHKYSLNDIEYMIPWERDVYVNMLIQQIKDQNEEAQRQSMQG